MQLKHVTVGAWGRSPQAAGGFFVIFWKKMAVLMRFESHLARFQSHLKQQNFLMFESQFNKSLPFSVPSKFSPSAKMPEIVRTF